MRVTHLATSTVGGAGIAARRLSQALNLIGVESVLISGDRTRNINDSHEFIAKKSSRQIFTSKALTLSQKIFVQSGDDLVTPYSIRTLNLESILKTNPDIIHIHSFYNLLSESEIEKIVNLGIPVFITLHDERILTGGCHCTNECINFQSNCEKCPQTKMIFHKVISDRKLKWRKLLNQNKSINLICPSDWVASQVKRAGVNLENQTVTIRNPISPGYLNIQTEDSIETDSSPYVVTFISHNLDNSYKGLDNILKCISEYSNELSAENIHFRFVGSGSRLTITGVQFEQLPILNESEMIEMYKTTDLLIVPSKTDNSPNIIFEAAMCGVPFLGSNRTGLPELSEIFNLPTFEFGNPKSLLRAILSVKSSPIDKQLIRSLALEHVDPHKVAIKLKSLYQMKLTEADSTRSSKEF